MPGLPIPYKVDIQRMLDDQGVPVTIAGVTARCIVSDSDEEIARDANAVLIGRAIVVRADRDAFPGAVQGAAIVVDYPEPGTQYRIAAVWRDLQLVRLICAKV